jgi:hypothetical protein
MLRRIPARIRIPAGIADEAHHLLDLARGSLSGDPYDPTATQAHGQIIETIRHRPDPDYLTIRRSSSASASVATWPPTRASYTPPPKRSRWTGTSSWSRRSRFSTRHSTTWQPDEPCRSGDVVIGTYIHDTAAATTAACLHIDVAEWLKGCSSSGREHGSRPTVIRQVPRCSRSSAMARRWNGTGRYGGGCTPCFGNRRGHDRHRDGDHPSCTSRRLRRCASEAAPSSGLCSQTPQCDRRRLSGRSGRDRRVLWLVGRLLRSRRPARGKRSKFCPKPVFYRIPWQAFHEGHG